MDATEGRFHNLALRGFWDSTWETARRMLLRARLQAVVIVVWSSRQQMILYKDDAHVER